MSLKFVEIKLNKKESHRSKQSIYSSYQVEISKIVVSDETKHDDECIKFFFGYKNSETVKPLCIILPQMSGFIKYFKTTKTTCLFLLIMMHILKYSKIWKKLKS